MKIKALAILSVVALASACGDAAPPGPSPQPVTAIGISFVSSAPEPGADVVTTNLGSLGLTFSVIAPEAIPGARLEMKLMNGSGEQCGYAFSQTQDLPAGTRLTFANPSAVFVFDDHGKYQCALPAAITAVRVTLLTLTSSPGSPYLTRTEYHTDTFPIGYALREYPRPPGGAPTPPVIARFSWTGVQGCGSCPPVSGDPVNLTCVATAADGAEATTTLTMTWDGATPSSKSHTFPAGATSSPKGAVFSFGWGAVGQPPRATAECRVMNIRGETATSTIRIPG